MEIEAIAYFCSPFSSKFGIPRQSGLVNELKGEIRFHEKYRRREALKGIEDFDYLWLIWGFSANRQESGNWQPTVRPPRLGGNANMGVFATRSPFRPNPIGLSSVKLESVEYDVPGGPVIHVSGADLMDGTPIYDIKPYITYADSHPDASSGFVDRSTWKELEVKVSEGLKEELISILGEDEYKALLSVLALDPRPQYKKDGDRQYGMPFKGYDILFTVEEGGLTVTAYRKL